MTLEALLALAPHLPGAISPLHLLIGSLVAWVVLVTWFFSRIQ